jgi:hypothetical protein
MMSRSINDELALSVIQHLITQMGLHLADKK